MVFLIYEIAIGKSMKGPRFSDSDDFNEIHDSINISLLSNYYKFVEMVSEKLKNSNLIANFKVLDAEIKGEISLCKKYYPDDIVNIHYSYEFPKQKLSGEVNLKFVIEIKSKIKSFGETLRQLQIYKECIEYYNNREIKRKIGRYVELKNINYVYLLTPDHRFDSAFLSQGFEVLDPSIFGNFKEKGLDNF
ncbi:MAG: hypothetical protein ACP5JT_05630 [Thermoplasmata archaeon]|jgi:hypothetical protein